jgi:hypothetical protein
MTVLLHLSSALLAWALEAAQIFVVLCGCAVCGWALGFRMGYRRGVDECCTHYGIGTDQALMGNRKEPRQRRGSALNTTTRLEA